MNREILLDPLEKFREEIRGLVESEKTRKSEKEEEKEGDIGRGHFPDDFNTDDLDEGDMEYYKRFKNGSLDLVEINKRIEEIRNSGNINEARKALMSYIASQMQKRVMDQT